MPNEFDLTPNYTAMFRTFVREAKFAGEPEYLLTGLRGQDRIAALRNVQRFLAPLAIAAQCMTSVVEIAEFRTLIAEINESFDRVASGLEYAVAEQEVRLCPYHQDSLTWDSCTEGFEGCQIDSIREVSE